MAVEQLMVSFLMDVLTPQIILNLYNLSTPLQLELQDFIKHSDFFQSSTFNVRKQV